MKQQSFALATLLLCATGFLPAQPPPSPITNQVLVTLTVKPTTSREQVMAVMQDEVRATVRLYLGGTIQQWFSRGDGKGVVFLLNCKTTADARSIMEALPLAKGSLVDLDYLPVGPLMPLGMLLAPASAPPAPAQQP